MFVEREELLTESDVEQKLIWPILTTAAPLGFGYETVDVKTKLSIRRLEIGKGASKRLYFPDYMVLLAGLPLLVIEAKSPAESAEDGLEEARLYAAQLNALFPTGFNPCIRVVSCNGKQLLSSPWDSSLPDFTLGFEELSATDQRFAQLAATVGRAEMQRHADDLRATRTSRPYRRPTHLVGGQSVRNEQIAPNTFGLSLIGDYGHLFNPRSREDRAYIVKNAYVPSPRRERFVEPIDRLIRGATPPALRDVRLVDDTGSPKELTDTLSGGRTLEHQILLLVGSVGSGKSTFVDYLMDVALPHAVTSRTVWVRMDLNAAPLSRDMAYDWILEQLVTELQRSRPDLDFDSLPVLELVHSPAIKKLKKGALALLTPGSPEYQTRFADHLLELQRNKIATAQGMVRFICGETARLLVVVLDNCDKRTRDDQLTMFQVAEWVQREFRCLVFLPLRDVTYDIHRSEPPLDTALKQLVFRIEPPRFTDVLAGRVRLALEAMQVGSPRLLTYELPNGIKVSYPASDQGMYLASILKSLYAYDKFVRRVVSGLAGRTSAEPWRSSSTSAVLATSARQRS